MRSLLMLCLGLSLVRAGQAQERVRNVRLRVADSAQLEILYDLINARPGDSVYVAVRSRLRGSLDIRPEFVRGDVGRRVVAGSDRRIVWNALANGYSLNEEVRATVSVKTGLGAAPQPPSPTEPVAVAQPPANRPTPDNAGPPKRADPVVVQPRPVPTDAPSPAVQPPARATEPPAQPGVDRPIVAVPDVDRPATTVPPDTAGPPHQRTGLAAFQKRRYAGPAWALLSAVAPGFGNVFVQTPKPRIGFRPLLAVGCYGLLVYGLRERQQSRDAYALYEEQKNAEMAAPYYRTANDHHHRYYLATRGAIVAAAADVMLTFFKGLRNGRAAAASRPVPSVSLRPGLQAGQPTAVVRYAF